MKVNEYDKQEGKFVKTEENKNVKNHLRKK